jgi:predicted MFS family arabinose efflux permease
VVFGIVSTDTHSWGSTQVVVALLVGAGLLRRALGVEAFVAGDPLVPLSIFRRRSLSAANGIAATIGGALFGMYFFLSLYLQQVAGFSPLRAGLAFLPAGLATLIGALGASRLVAVLGPRRQLIIGPAIAAIGLLWLTGLSAGGEYWTHIFGPLLLFGYGIGTTFVPMTLAATTGVPPHEAGLASGLINTTRQMGGAIGLAIMGTMAASRTQAQLGGHHSVGAALTSGYDRAFLIAGVILLVGSGLALLIRSSSPESESATATQEIARAPMVAEV